MKNWKDYSFVVRSEHRKSVFEALGKPKTPSQLSKELAIDLGASSITGTLTVTDGGTGFADSIFTTKLRSFIPKTFGFRVKA